MKTSHDPIVSICIPTYGQTEYLRRTLASIAKQDFKDYEIVITDDTPDDSVKDLLREFSFGEKLRYRKNASRLGQAMNHNETVTFARGTYVKILHHDDELKETTSLSEYVRMIKSNPDADFGFSASVGIGKNGEILVTNKPSAADTAFLAHESERLFFRNVIGSPSVVIFKRDIGLTFDKNLTWLIDIDFYMRVLKRNGKFAYTDKILVSITADGDHQETKKVFGNKNIEIPEIFYVYEKIGSQIRGVESVKFFWRLLRRYGISSTTELPRSPLITRIPAEIRLILAAKRAVPLWVRAAAKRAYRSAKFVRDFRTFKKLSAAKGKTDVLWSERSPQLFDNTPVTSFDAHYVYHPAWAARAVRKIAPKLHIDISSILSFSTMLSAFIPTVFYDYRPARLTLDNLKSERCDLRALPFKDRSVESISCMHTVEHIGLGRYGDALDPEGDVKAINELKRVVAKGGSLLFVVPIGGEQKVYFNAHRVYTYRQIRNLFDGFRINDFMLIPDDAVKNGTIANATEADADKQRYGCGCFWFIKE